MISIVARGVARVRRGQAASHVVRGRPSDVGQNIGPHQMQNLFGGRHWATIFILRTQNPLEAPLEHVAGHSNPPYFVLC
jgi:hypothetical protein